jgi:hypothetical protein
MLASFGLGFSYPTNVKAFPLKYLFPSKKGFANPFLEGNQLYWGIIRILKFKAEC